MDDSNSPNSNTSSDGLKSLLIQKECEIVCLRSELELYKKQDHTRELIENNTDSFLVDMDDDLDSIISNAEKKNNSISEKITSVQRYNTFCPKIIPQEVNIAHQTVQSLMNSGDGRENLEAQVMEDNIIKSEIVDSVNLLQNPLTIAQKIQEYYRKEFEREKYELQEKEVELERDRMELEELRQRLHFKKEELHVNKVKIANELRKILDEDESLTGKDLVEEKSEKDYFIDVVNDLKYSSRSIPSIDDSESIDEYQWIHVDPPRQKVRETLGRQEMDECKTDDNTDYVTKKLINACENKINNLYQFMSIWKLDAEKQAQETETMLNEFVNKNEELENSTSTSDACHEIVNVLSKEWAEVREIHEEIKKQREDLIAQKNELEARAVVIEEKEKILIEDKTESEKRKVLLKVNHDCLQSEAECLNNEKQILIKEINSLEESRNALEKEKNELVKLKAQYEEEMLIAEEIQKQVDERRVQTMLEQQKCLDEKWETLEKEKEEVKKAWRRYENQLLELEIQKNSMNRECQELKLLQQSLERERLSVEENRNLLQGEWKNYYSQNKDLEDKFSKLTEEKKVITEGLKQLDHEKNKLKDMTESLNRRKEEIKEEERILGENKLKMMNEKKLLSKKKAEAEIEWKKIKKEWKTFLCKKDECDKGKAIRNKKLENSENVRKINNKIYKFAEAISDMRTDAVELNETKNQKFIKYAEKEISEKRFNKSCQCSEYFQEKVYNLLELLNNLEEDASKIRIKFNEQAKFQKRIRMIRKKIKCGQITNGKPQENRTISKDIENKKVSSLLTQINMNKNGVMAGLKDSNLTKQEKHMGMNLIPKLDKGNSLMTMLQEEYITDLTPRRANYAKEKYLIDEWKNTYLIRGDNFHTEILTAQADVTTDSYKKRYEKINLNCWKKYSIDKVRVAELTPSRIYNYAEGFAAVKGKKPWVDSKLKESQYAYSAYHTCDNSRCDNMFRCSAQNTLKMHSPFSYTWFDQPDLSASSRIRRERILSVQRGCLNYVKTNQ